MKLTNSQQCKLKLPNGRIWFSVHFVLYKIEPAFINKHNKNKIELIFKATARPHYYSFLIDFLIIIVWYEWFAAEWPLLRFVIAWLYLQLTMRHTTPPRMSHSISHNCILRAHLVPLWVRAARQEWTENNERQSGQNANMLPWSLRTCLSTIMQRHGRHTVRDRFSPRHPTPHRQPYWTKRDYLVFRERAGVSMRTFHRSCRTLSHAMAFEARYILQATHPIHIRLGQNVPHAAAIAYTVCVYHNWTNALCRCLSVSEWM